MDIWEIFHYETTATVRFLGALQAKDLKDALIQASVRYGIPMHELTARRPPAMRSKDEKRGGQEA